MRRILTIAFFWISLAAYSPAASAQDQKSVSQSDSCMIEAQMAYNRHLADSVRILCRKAIEFNPRNDAAYYMLAKVALIGMDLEEAERNLKAATGIDSTNYYYLSTLGAVYMQNNDSPSAIALFEKLVDRFPTKTEPYLSLINLYVPRGMQDKALALADKLEQKTGPNEAATMTRFKIYSSQGKAEKALQALIDADEKTPNPMYEAYIADIYASSGKDSSALAWYTKALEAESDYVPAIYGKMQTFRRQKNYGMYLIYLKSFLGNPDADINIKKSHLEEAMKNPVFYQQFREGMADCLMELAKANPADSSAAITSAIYLSRSGEAEKASKVLNNILKYYPEDRYLRGNMLSFLYSTQNWERLEGFADTSMALFPELAPDLFQFKGMAEYNLGKYDAAIQTFLSQEKNVRKQKDSSLLLQIYSLVGDMYHEKWDNKSAFKYYDKALKIDPGNAPVLNNYAWYLLSSEQNPSRKTLERALKMSKASIDNSSGQYHYLDTYAWILYHLGRYEEAKKYMQQAIAYGGDSDDGILQRYAEILYVNGDYDMALRYYGKALLNVTGKDDQISMDMIKMRMEAIKAEQIEKEK
ncbi:MAG: tetratricopeptide repeat protein [Bacteroidales bacterium]|nr:tetratricopeptide repeat protein [Bacteroidales bacterium]